MQCVSQLFTTVMEFNFTSSIRFVCAKAAVHAAGRVTVFRTYEHPYEPGIDPPIWQVARATCTISDFLDQISIDEVRYIDCGMGVSNPVKVVLREADAIYVQRPLSCIISIGSGQAETIDIRRPSWWKRIAFGTISDGAIRAVQAIATDCEADADDVHTRLCFKLGDKIDDHYIRFNADRGMQSVRLNKWERLGDVKALTMDYLGGPETRAKASRAVNGMTSREGITGSLNVSKTYSMHSLTDVPYTLFIANLGSYTATHTPIR